jgi:hypothetical protein
MLQSKNNSRKNTDSTCSLFSVFVYRLQKYNFFANPANILTEKLRFTLLFSTFSLVSLQIRRCESAKKLRAANHDRSHQHKN